MGDEAVSDEREAEWQPAVIAPYDPSHPGIEFPEDWIRIAGERVRVGFFERPDVYGCGSEFRVLLHPEDGQRLFGESRVRACSHMILTD